MNKVMISAGALAALALSTPAFAANTAPATATVNIVSPLTLTNNSALNFGTIVANSGAFAGEVVHMDMLNNRTCPATLTCSGTTVTSAGFTVSGTKGQTVVLTMPAGVVLNGPGGATLNVDLSGDEPATNPVLDATTGLATFAIGGKLTIPAGTGAGVYSNTFNVTANYQ